LSTSYTDVLDISVAERTFLIKFIREKQEATKEAIEAAKARNAAGHK
jgi:hypothetical protein